MVYPELNVSASGITDILTYPLTGDYYFYGKILVGLYFILVSVLFIEENERTGRSSFLSAMAIASFAVIIIAFAGSLAGIITSEIFILTVVLGGIQIGIWFFIKAPY